MAEAYGKVMAVLSRYCFHTHKEFFHFYKITFGTLDFNGLMRSVNKPTDNFDVFTQHLAENFPRGIQKIQIIGDTHDSPFRDYLQRDFTAQEWDLASFRDQFHALVPPSHRISSEQLWELYRKVWKTEHVDDIKSLSAFRWKLTGDHEHCCRQIGKFGDFWEIDPNGPRVDPVVAPASAAAGGTGNPFGDTSYESEREALLRESKDPRDPRFVISEEQQKNEADKILKVFEKTAFVDEDSFLDMCRDVCGGEDFWDSDFLWHYSDFFLLTTQNP
jgi:hypothetical protein